jgi:hypothetical protein
MARRSSPHSQIAKKSSVARFVHIAESVLLRKTTRGRDQEICVMKRLRTVLVTLAITITTGADLFASGVAEETFNLLEIGSRTYRNVTVTTKSKNYIFILHSAGMTNIKVADLPTDLQQRLGYSIAPKVPTNNASVWAKQTIAKIETPKVKQAEAAVSQTWQSALSTAEDRLPPLTPQFLLQAVVAGFCFYLFVCYCFMLICQKTGNEPGPLVWVPLLQLFPLLRAASMSRWWFILFLVPGLNLISHVIWCVKIVEARHKTTPLLVLLLLPVTSLFAFLYLAFSEAAPQRKSEPRVEIMTLETA